MSYEEKLIKLKEYRDIHKYNEILNVLIARYEITLIKYRLLNDVKYKHILDEFDVIIKWLNIINGNEGIKVSFACTRIKAL